MKGEKQIIERLNEALFLELGAVNQYWVHFRLLEDWGYAKLAKKERAESIEEMHHADKLVARIIFLEGHPNLQSVAPLRIGQNVKEVLESDLAGEYDARTSYKKSREICQEAGDYVTMKLFEELLTDEEGHIDFLETQLDLLASIGEEKYGQLNAASADEAGLRTCGNAARPRILAPLAAGRRSWPVAPEDPAVSAFSRGFVCSRGSRFRLRPWPARRNRRAWRRAAPI